MSVESPLSWTEDGQPRSRLFGDVYFSAEDGLSESRAVFLQGCGLPQGFAGRRRFVVGELGFGSGLNIVALLDLWRQARPADGHLHIFSIEAFPITADEAARALGHWPEVASVTDLLIARWPGHARGRHRVELPEFAATLDLAIMDVTQALQSWHGRADAWFLDGFSPALNPQMWSDEVLALVAARSAPGARAATFTVAGHVRRSLTAAGFEVGKRPGFGRKRERLEAIWPGCAAEPPPCRVAIIGAGIAGAAAARAVRAIGGEATVVEAALPGAGGSGNPVALVTPRLDAALGEAAALFAQAFATATALYRAVPDAVAAEGVLQLATDPRDHARFTRIAASDIFEPGALAMIPAAETAQRLGEPVPDALDQRSALAVRPAPVLAAWLGDIVTAKVHRIEPGGQGWRLLAADGAEIMQADAVILAAALHGAELFPGLSLQPVRGQASWTTDGASLPATAWGGYALPTGEGVLFGATHDRGDCSVDVRDDDHDRNRRTLATALPGLAARMADAQLAGRASIRAVTPDRLPVAGQLAEGLFALTGFGSRGFSLAPLLAEHVAALALGAPSPISCAAADLVAPDRFARRAAKRAGAIPAG